MEELMKMVSNVGFPIAITAYLMIRFEAKLDKLTETITKLVLAIENKQQMYSIYIIVIIDNVFKIKK